MAKTNKTPDFRFMAQKLKEDMIRYVSVAGVEFFKDSFQNQGFTNDSLEPWAKRANDIDPGRKILVKSSTLLHSIRVFEANEKRIRFGSDAVYSDIHNEGGMVTIQITPRSRKYFWFMFKKTKNSMWKALALTKKNSITINIPRRQFMGESLTLMRQFDSWVINEIEKRFKQLL